MCHLPCGEVVVLEAQVCGVAAGVPEELGLPRWQVSGSGSLRSAPSRSPFPTPDFALFSSMSPGVLSGGESLAGGPGVHDLLSAPALVLPSQLRRNFTSPAETTNTV